MDDLIHHLENRIKILSEKCDQLIKANSKLQKNSNLLLKEKETLLNKNKIAITQIENMVARLKSLEEIQ